MAETLKEFIYQRTESGAKVFTDEAAVYKGLEGVEHKAVKHSVGEYVDGQAHNERLGIILVLVEAGLPWDVSQDECETFG